MKVKAELIIKLRKERSWSQDELAIAAGLNLRTVQRVEKDALASLQTKKALAAALAIDPRDLDQEGLTMKPCPICGSDEIYQYKEYFRGRDSTGETLIPGLNSNMFLVAKIRTTVCHGCGHVRIFASEDARERLKSSKHWKLVNS